MWTFSKGHRVCNCKIYTKLAYYGNTRIPMLVSLKNTITIFRIIVWSKCLILNVNDVDYEIDALNTRKEARK